MSEETTETTGEQTEQKQQPEAVPYERFKEVNEKYKALNAEVTALKESQKQAEEAKAKEQGEYKTLYETLQNELKAEKLTNMKLKISSSKGLPAELTNRVQGTTEDEITADVESLLAFIKEKPAGVPPPPKGGSSTNFDFSNATPAQVREYLAKQK